MLSPPSPRYARACICACARTPDASCMHKWHMHMRMHSCIQYVVSASMDCTVMLWAVHNGQCLRRYRGHRHWVNLVRFTPNGKQIISSGLDKQIFVWSLRAAAAAATNANSSNINNSANGSGLVWLDSATGTAVVGAAGDGFLDTGAASSASNSNTSGGRKGAAAGSGGGGNLQQQQQQLVDGGGGGTGGGGGKVPAAIASAMALGLPLLVSALHSDYVLAMVCLRNNSVVSCARDKTVKIWNHLLCKQVRCLRVCVCVWVTD